MGALSFYLARRTGVRSPPVPQPPVAVGDSRNIGAAETTVSVNVLANDRNVSGGVVTIQGAVIGANAVVAGDNRTIQVTRIGTAAGAYSLTYRVTTAYGFSQAILSGTIQAVPVTPIAVDDTRNLTATEITAEVAVLANDSNVSGAVVTIQGSVTGATAAVMTDGKKIKVTRIGTGSGPYSLTYRATTSAGFDDAILSGSIAAYTEVGIDFRAGTTGAPGAVINFRAGTTAAPGAIIPFRAGTS